MGWGKGSGAEDLLGLLSSSRPEACSTALTPGGPMAFGTFKARAAAVAASAGAGQRWVVACEDAFDFATVLFGLVQAGATPVLPPNTLPGTLEALAADGAGVILAPPEAPGPALAPCGVLADVPVEFWTSGSTGAPKRVARRFSQLATEVRILDELFGDRLPEGPVAGTVPHHHIYGLLFRILWPLARNRPFLVEPCGDPARFRALMAQEPRPALVSSPAHLARLPRILALEGLAIPAVFSSGGALERSDALAWRAWAPSGVVEIYGSTESGGIGWRNPDARPASSLWTPFPDVTLASAEDGALLLASSRVGPGPLRMEDAVALHPGGRFELLGRLDRVVKLEEKRISLPQLEEALAAHPLVSQAAMVVLEGGGRRRALGAVVVLATPQVPEPGPLKALLRAHLARTFDPAALPRRWRFLRELPRDARGKLVPETLARLFK